MRPFDVTIALTDACGCSFVSRRRQFRLCIERLQVGDDSSRSVRSHRCSHHCSTRLVHRHRSVTRCLHFTAGCITDCTTTGYLKAAGCTTGWVNYANERSQAALERSSQDADDVIRLTCSKAAVWTVDDVARLIELKNNSSLFIHLFLPSIA